MRETAPVRRAHPTEMRNQRIAVRFMQGETSPALASIYGLSVSRVWAILGQQLRAAQAWYALTFSEIARDLDGADMRLRLLYLHDQIEHATGRSPLKFSAPASEKIPPSGEVAGQGPPVCVNTRSEGISSLPARAGCVAAGQGSRRVT